MERVGDIPPDSGDHPVQGYGTGKGENAVPARKRFEFTHADVVKGPGQTKGS